MMKYHSVLLLQMDITNVNFEKINERALCMPPTLDLQLVVVIRSLKGARNEGGEQLFKSPLHRGTPDGTRNPLSPTKASGVPLSMSAIAWLFSFVHLFFSQTYKLFGGIIKPR